MEKPHKKLDVWKVSMDLVTTTYKQTASFPEKEIYCLTTQIRRAAISIPSNIAEGAARNTRREFVNFLHIAQGSLSELDTQMEIAKRLEYLKENDWKSLGETAIRIDKMLSGLIKQVRGKA